MYIWRFQRPLRVGQRHLVARPGDGPGRGSQLPLQPEERLEPGGVLAAHHVAQERGA